MAKIRLTRSGKGQRLYKQAKEIIPGGTQLLSKRPEMFLPDFWPAYYEKAKGCQVWDLDGNEFIDMSTMGVGSCILGYADDDVNKAVAGAIKKGSMTTLNAPEEVELAQLLITLHPWAGMVRFARTGGEAMSVAVRIARAHTRKDIVLFCGYHGWHDWYLSSNLADEVSLDGQLLPGLEPSGVVRSLRETSIPFKYNDIDSFMALISQYKNRIAAVVMEPVRNFYPDAGFLQKIREVTHKQHIVLVIDEVSSGWRIALGGAHLKLNLEPDIAVFAKGMSNGYPMAAIIGRKSIMQAVQGSFISSTYWTERVGPVAALAAIQKMKKTQTCKSLQKTGKKVQEGWQKLAVKNRVKISIAGIYPLSYFSFTEGEPLTAKTMFTQLMLEQGFLAATGFYASLAHQDKFIDRYLNAVDQSFYTMAKAQQQGTLASHLKGPVAHAGFRRLT